MELNDFITKTLIQISQGICSAQVEIGKMGGIVNPAVTTNNRGEQFLALQHNQPLIKDINFDISVAVEDEKTAINEGKINISVLGADTSKETVSSNQHVHKIHFSIPVLFPYKLVKSNVKNAK